MLTSYGVSIVLCCDSDFTGGGGGAKQPACFESIVKTLLVHNTFLYKFLVRLHGEYNILVKLCGNT